MQLTRPAQDARRDAHSRGAWLQVLVLALATVPALQACGVLDRAGSLEDSLETARSGRANAWQPIVDGGTDAMPDLDTGVGDDGFDVLPDLANGEAGLADEGMNMAPMLERRRINIACGEQNCEACQAGGDGVCRYAWGDWPAGLYRIVVRADDGALIPISVESDEGEVVSPRADPIISTGAALPSNCAGQIAEPALSSVLYVNRPAGQSAQNVTIVVGAAAAFSLEVVGVDPDTGLPLPDEHIADEDGVAQPPRCDKSLINEGAVEWLAASDERGEPGEWSAARDWCIDDDHPHRSRRVTWPESGCLTVEGVLPVGPGDEAPLARLMDWWTIDLGPGVDWDWIDRNDFTVTLSPATPVGEMDPGACGATQEPVDMPAQDICQFMNVEIQAVVECVQAEDPIGGSTPITIDENTISAGDGTCCDVPGRDADAVRSVECSRGRAGSGEFSCSEGAPFRWRSFSLRLTDARERCQGKVALRIGVAMDPIAGNEDAIAACVEGCNGCGDQCAEGASAFRYRLKVAQPE